MTFISFHTVRREYEQTRETAHHETAIVFRTEFPNIVRTFYSKPKRFEMAVWLAATPEPHLHALAVGGTNNKRTVQINYIESFPYDCNPFKGSVFPIAEVALTYYGFLIEAERIRILDALPEVVPYYQSRGFVIEHVGAARHNLVKELR